MASVPGFSDVEGEEKFWSADDIYYLHDQGASNTYIANELNVPLSLIGDYLRARERGHKVKGRAELLKNRLARSG